MLEWIRALEVVSAAKDWKDEAMLVPHECIRWWNANLLEAPPPFDMCQATSWDFMFCLAKPVVWASCTVDASCKLLKSSKLPSRCL